MKAQGLPINFIVIAALAILVLILAAGFVIAGGSAFGGAVGPEQARSTCNNFCVTAQRSAGNLYNTSQMDSFKIGVNATGTYEQKFCTAKFDIKGIGTGVTCTTLVGSCLVTFGDGTTFSINAAACASTP